MISSVRHRTEKDVCVCVCVCVISKFSSKQEESDLPTGHPKLGTRRYSLKRCFGTQDAVEPKIRSIRVSAK